MLRLLAQSASHRQAAGAAYPLSALQPRCSGCASLRQAGGPAAFITKECQGEQRAPEAAIPQQSADSLRRTPYSGAGTAGANNSDILQASRIPALRHVADSLRPSFSPPAGSQPSPPQRQGTPPPSPRSAAQPSLGCSFTSRPGEQARQVSADLTDGRWLGGACRLPSAAAMHGLQSSGLVSGRPLSGKQQRRLPSRMTPVLADRACPSAGVRRLATVRAMSSR